MEITPIAYARNGFTDKFGIPRQSRENSQIETRIVFVEPFAVPEALRGIEDYSHLWLIWGFSATPSSSFVPTVRPPRLGGNRRMGVFATRSPFRPNRLGLTSVRLLRVENGELIVSGADLLDGTPIYDIKPYLSFSDSHPDARNGFAEQTKDYHLPVFWDVPAASALVDESMKKQLEEILSQDPRPAYQTDSSRIYRLDYGGINMSFRVAEDGVHVVEIHSVFEK